MADEEWRPIPNWPYEASSIGRIRRAAQPGKEAGRILAPMKNREGRLIVNVSKGGWRKGFIVGRLVCMAFHGLPPHPNSDACYRDKNHLNATPDNVFWGRRDSGNRCHLTADQRAEMRSLRASGAKFHDIADKFGVALSSAWLICRSGAEGNAG